MRGATERGTAKVFGRVVTTIVRWSQHGDILGGRCARCGEFREEDASDAREEHESCFQGAGTCVASEAWSADPGGQNVHDGLERMVRWLEGWRMLQAQAGVRERQDGVEVRRVKVERIRRKVNVGRRVLQKESDRVRSVQALSPEGHGDRRREPTRGIAFDPYD